MPELAPEPANPIKCIEPTLLANREAPTYAFQLRIEIIISKAGNFRKMRSLESSTVYFIHRLCLL